MADCLPLLWKTVRLHGKKLQNATKKVLSRIYITAYSTFSVVSFTFLVHKLLLFLAKRDNFFPCVALGVVHKRRRNWKEVRGLKFGQNLQTDTLKSLTERHARLDFSKQTLLEDFQPGSLINLKNITSLLAYSVLLT